MAFATEDSSPDSLLGSFDLSNPTSCLRFAQLILMLRAQYETVIDAASTIDIDTAFAWRADLIDYRHESHRQSIDRQLDRIKSWAADVQISSDSRFVESATIWYKTLIPRLVVLLRSQSPLLQRIPSF